MLHYIDAYVGIPSILYDTDTERRTLYGKAGCFRLCSYGFEYRTLSSYWIANESRLHFIFKQLYYALYNYERGTRLPDPYLIRSTIDNNDVEIAKKIIKEHNLIHPNNIIPE